MTNSPNPIVSQRVIESEKSSLALTVTKGASNMKLLAQRDMPDERHTLRLWTKPLANGSLGVDIEIVTQPRGVDGKPYSGYEQKFKLVLDAEEAALMFGEDDD